MGQDMWTTSRPTGIEPKMLSDFSGICGSAPSRKNRGQPVPQKSWSKSGAKEAGLARLAKTKTDLLGQAGFYFAGCF